MKKRVLGSALRTGVTRLLALAVLASLVACAGTAGTETVAPEDVPVVTLADDTVIAEGVVEPARWVELSFDRSTTAVDVLVEEGDTVSPGDPLIRFDPLDAQLAIQQAEAALALAKTQLVRASLSPRPEPIALAEAGVVVAGAVISHTTALRDEITSGQMRSDIAAVQAALAAATAEQRQAENLHDRTLNCFTFTLPGGVERKICPALGRPEEFSRFAMLAADAGLAAAELQLTATQNSAYAQLRAADASIESALAQKDAALARLAQASLGPTPEQIASAQAAVAQAEAALSTAQAALDDLDLPAPFAGTVVDLAIGSGETAAPGRPLLMLATLDELIVRTVDLVELDVARVSEGQMATITVDALPDIEFEGQVARIDLQSLDYRGDVTYPVTIHLDEQPPELRWGMTTLVEIQVEEE